MLTIRPATLCDANAISHLVNQAYRPEPGACGWTHESDLVAGQRTSAEQVAQTLNRPDSVILLGSNNADIVACVHVEKDGRSSHIGMLAVHPALQGTGAGKRMLAQAEHHARTHFSAEKFIMLVLSSRLELVAFYLRRGYQKTGMVMDYPLTAGVGTPRQADLTIEVLEKAA